MEIYLRVHPTVFQYYKAIYGSECIDIRPNSYLSNKIKTILSVKPMNYKDCCRIKNFKILRVKIHEFRFGKNGTHINIEYSNFISDRNQYYLSKELYDIFKITFHNFVAGSVRSGRTQKQSIEDFCEAYNLDWDNVNFEMLKKSWDRSFEKSFLLNNYNNQSLRVDTLSPSLIQ